MIFSNPRLNADFTNWPGNGNSRVACKFYVEYKKNKGARVCRQTFNPLKRGWNAPKATTYGRKACIVTAEDGRVYILTLATHCEMISINSSDMQFSAGSVFDKDEQYPVLLDLLSQAEQAVVGN